MVKYIHTETGEVWTGQPSTSRTSNFYLLTHEEKVALGWELVEEPPAPEPTLGEKKASKLGFVRFRATAAIESVYPPYKQVNAALGIYDQATVDAIKAKIQSVRAKVAEYEAQINAGDLEFEVLF